MVDHDCGEKTPVTALQMVFQFVTASGTVSGGVVVVPVASQSLHGRLLEGGAQLGTASWRC